ncbi:MULTISPECIES: hypothetical protein [unclassified Rhodococcus (in: high G+C Gram-positive bacteria)]|uniref:hypothetical protein n=1 Tax=unclassified Rhodococcus (in: high G+C Gram-positive bacteria) TaxID=192944 RepID=UPI0003753940|nr:hypothetical protein [Rhodococcus sp. DK17]
MTRAAREAADLRAEVVEIIPNSRLLLESTILSSKQLYESRFKTFTAQGHPAAAHAGALESINLFQLDPQVLNNAQPADANAQMQLMRDHTTMRAADLFVVSPVMHAMAIAAASTLDDEDLRLWREEDLPSHHGFVLFPSPVVFQQSTGLLPDEIAGLSWRLGTVYIGGDKGPRTQHQAAMITAWYDGAGEIKRQHYLHDVAIARRRGERYPSIVPFHHCYAALATTDTTPMPTFEQVDASVPSAEVIGEYSGDAVTGHILGVWMPKYLLALTRLLQQPKQATERPYREGIDARARWRPHHDVRVVQARAVTPADTLSDDPNIPRKYRHRWTVRMHKVNQYYPKEGVHRIIWRGPYIKGPTDAPMLQGEKVNAVTE